MAQPRLYVSTFRLDGENKTKRGEKKEGRTKALGEKEDVSQNVGRTNYGGDQLEKKGRRKKKERTNVLVA